MSTSTLSQQPQAPEEIPTPLEPEPQAQEVATTRMQTRANARQQRSIQNSQNTQPVQVNRTLNVFTPTPGTPLKDIGVGIRRDYCHSHQRIIVNRKGDGDCFYHMQLVYPYTMSITEQ